MRHPLSPINKENSQFDFLDNSTLFRRKQELSFLKRSKVLQEPHLPHRTLSRRQVLSFVAEFLDASGLRETKNVLMQESALDVLAEPSLPKKITSNSVSPLEFLLDTGMHQMQKQRLEREGTA